MLHPRRSVGVEEELLLFDSASGTPATAGEQVLMAWEQIELVGPPLFGREDIQAAIRLGRRRLDEAALAVGSRAVPLTTSPVPVYPHLTESVRYRHRCPARLRHGVRATL